MVNLPLMTDEERELVGICYKQRGQQAAIELGHRLVGGAVKAARLDAWAAFAKAHPDGYLYCFRGGLRSQIVQQWLRDEAGIAYPRVTGGYGAMRGFLLDTLDRAIAECDFLVLGGMTGTGKTEVLRRLDDALDLEGHANHRGSSFGKRVSGQPAQINFDNALAIDILRKRAAGHARFVVEDEGQAVGSCSLPPALYQGMQRHGLGVAGGQPGESQAAHPARLRDRPGRGSWRPTAPSRARPCSRNACARAWTTSPGDWAAAPSIGHHGRALRGRALGLGVAGHLGWIEACCRNTTIP